MLKASLFDAAIVNYGLPWQPRKQKAAIALNISSLFKDFQWLAKLPPFTLKP